MTKRAQFISLLMAAFYIGIIILIWGAGTLMIQLINGSPATLTLDNIAYPLALGEISLTTLFFTLAVVSLNLFNEINGFRVSMGLVLASSLTTLIIWCAILLIPDIPFLVGGADLGVFPSMVLDLSFVHLFKLNVLLFIMLIVSLIYSLFRWLFKNDFYIVRYFLAHTIGLSVAAFLQTILDPTMRDQGTLLAGALVFGAQSLALFFILFPLHYFIKWPVLIFVGGKHRRYLRDRYGHAQVSQPVQTLPPPVITKTEKPAEDLPNPFSKEESISTHNFSA